MVVMDLLGRRYKRDDEPPFFFSLVRDNLGSDIGYNGC